MSISSDSFPVLCHYFKNKLCQEFHLCTLLNKKFRFNTNLSFLVMWIRRVKCREKCDCICIRIVSQKFQNWLNSLIFIYSFYNILYASVNCSHRLRMHFPLLRLSHSLKPKICTMICIIKASLNTMPVQYTLDICLKSKVTWVTK